MKKLGKKRSGNTETLQAYACSCAICACPPCMNVTVSSMLVSGQNTSTGGQLTYFN